MRLNLTGLLALAALTGCDLLDGKMSGDWDLEAVDADDCTMTMEIDQSGDELEGESDVDCLLFLTIGDDFFTYDMEASNADVEGDIDRDDGDFEIEVSFYDDFFEGEIVIELSGEVDGDDIEGEIIVDGDDFGDFEGEKD